MSRDSVNTTESLTYFNASNYIGNRKTASQLSTYDAMTSNLTKPAKNLSLFARLRLLPQFLRDRTVPFWKKGLLLMGLLYIISPVDAVPEIILPFIGWLDDIGLLTLLTMWTYRGNRKLEQGKMRKIMDAEL